jgi:hypothetical protein
MAERGNEFHQQFPSAKADYLFAGSKSAGAQHSSPWLNLVFRTYDILSYAFDRQRSNPDEAAAAIPKSGLLRFARNDHGEDSTRTRHVVIHLYVM